MMKQRTQHLVLIGVILLLVGIPLLLVMVFQSESATERGSVMPRNERSQEQRRIAQQDSDSDEQTKQPEEANECRYSFDWERSSIVKDLEIRPFNVIDAVVAQDGTVLVGFTDADQRSYVATLEEGASRWKVSGAIPGASSVRVLQQLSDGRYILGVSTEGSGGVLFTSTDGLIWTDIGGDVLPNTSATSVWDLVELSDGRVLIATNALQNDPSAEHPSLYVLNGEEVSELASFPGQGLLAMDVDHNGVIVVSTQESAEHDNPDLAGQARVFISEDRGVTWEEGGIAQGANRIYDLHFHSDGTLYAGSGIRGAFLRSKDQGRSWEKMTNVPTVQRAFGTQGEMRPVDVTRVYQILELCDGTMLVGTGNDLGDVFYTQDGGQTWQETENTGPNNVVWALTQAPDGSIWVGTGSFGGDVLVARP